MSCGRSNPFLDLTRDAFTKIPEELLKEMRDQIAENYNKCESNMQEFYQARRKILDTNTVHEAEAAGMQCLSCLHLIKTASNEVTAFLDKVDPNALGRLYAHYVTDSRSTPVTEEVVQSFVELYHGLKESTAAKFRQFGKRALEEKRFCVKRDVIVRMRELGVEGDFEIEDE